MLVAVAVALPAGQFQVGGQEGAQMVAIIMRPPIWVVVVVALLEILLTAATAAPGL
jgi:hypothetical protein